MPKGRKKSRDLRRTLAAPNAKSTKSESGISLFSDGASLQSVLGAIEENRSPKEVAEANAFLSRVGTWEALCEQLHAARPGRRLIILRAMWNILVESGRFSPNLVEGAGHILVDLLISSIAKGGGAEAILACQLCGAVMLTIGSDEMIPEQYDSVVSKLKQVSVTGQTGGLKGSAGCLLGLVAFLGCNDDLRREQSLEWFTARAPKIPINRKVFVNQDEDSDDEIPPPPDQELLEAEGFLLGWALLFSRCALRELGRWESELDTITLVDFCERTSHLCAMAKCVQPTPLSSGGLAGATAIVMGLLIQSLSEACHRDDGTWGENRASGQVEKIMQSTRPHLFKDLQILGGANQSGAAHLGRALSRGDRRAISAVFRDVMGTMEEEEFVCSRPKFHLDQSRVVFCHWAGVLRYDVFRMYLRGALSAHLSDSRSDTRPLLEGRDLGMSLIASYEATVTKKMQMSTRAREREAKMAMGGY